MAKTFRSRLNSIRCSSPSSPYPVDKDRPMKGGANAEAAEIKVNKLSNFIVESIRCTFELQSSVFHFHFGGKRTIPRG